ncbi:MAG: hypothetical protein M5U28_47825 [Sandaracinaceae bacterium]|nr:hypothetical protein [Sandaracinaceae bacterium]
MVPRARLRGAGGALRLRAEDRRRPRVDAAPARAAEGAGRAAADPRRRAHRRAPRRGRRPARRGGARRVGGAPRLRARHLALARAARGLPFGEWRFEHRGRPVGEWRTLHHLRAGAGSLYLAPDPEALEWRWMAGTRIDREVVADALRIRLVPRGALSPAAARLTVRSIERIDPPGDPPAPPASWCEREIDLLERVHQGRVFARNVAPRPSVVHFHLDPLPPGAGLAEVHFPVRPCDEACFFASLGVDAPPSESDGVVFEVHLIHGAERPLLREIEVLPGGEVPIEIPIHLWPGRPQLLRIGTRPRASEAGDYAFVSAPRVAPCSARAWLAEDEGDLVVPAEGATLRRSFHVIPSTCFAAGAESTPPGAHERAGGRRRARARPARRAGHGRLRRGAARLDGSRTSR